MSRNKNRNHDRSRNNRDEREIDVKSKTQSNVYESLKFDASNIYFSNLLGTQLHTEYSTASQTALPGILVYDTALNLSTRSDMVNVAATAIYTFVRHANSGRANYESSDLMMYLLSIGEVYVGLAELFRAYGLANFFTARNLYSSRLLEAAGFNASGVRNNLANIRYAINVLVNKMKAFAVPRVFNYFDERISEFMGVYRDDNSEESQFIIRRPSSLGQFDATTEGGGSIEFIDNSLGNRDIIAQINKIDGMLTILRQNEDMNIISGDILKAYGSNLFVLEALPAEYVTVPVYDELVLGQLQNAHVPGVAVVGSLVQEENKISHEVKVPVGVSAVSLYDKKRFLNSPTAEVDPNLIFALSKYQIVTGTPSDGKAKVLSGNTTILTRLRVSAIETDGSISFLAIPQANSSTVAASYIVPLTKFKSHTYLYSKSHVLPIGDMQYVAVVNEEDTARMNDARFILNFQTVQMG